CSGHRWLTMNFVRVSPEGPRIPLGPLHPSWRRQLPTSSVGCRASGLPASGSGSSTAHVHSHPPSPGPASTSSVVGVERPEAAVTVVAPDDIAGCLDGGSFPGDKPLDLRAPLDPLALLTAATADHHNRRGTPPQPPMAAS
ncbi:hypothetical protein, partial [Salinispora arenicola]|uniref:hypothetical protein n=1 Tax=Salinispora arenicola TaxID=168697 RepID=UPI0027DE4373